MSNVIAVNLASLHNQIIDAQMHYGRKNNAIKLLAVSKSQPTTAILQAIQAGQYDFGENYLQEALPKIHELNDSRITWHFIGPIQVNKTRGIAENFSWVHSVCRLKIAQRLHDQRPAHLPRLNVCIQVNVSNDPNKSGIILAELPKLAENILQLPRLHLRGLMTIPSYSPDFEQQRIPFRMLRIAQEQLQTAGFPLDTLSMGMSDDFVAAIAEGATLLRIGSKIFKEAI